jgi:hypothetical protein
VSLFSSLISPEPPPTLTHHRFLSRSASSTYKSLFPQILCFLIDTKPQGWRTPLAFSADCPLSTAHYPLCFLVLVDSLPQLQNSTPAFSSGCGLFRKKCRGGLQLDGYPNAQMRVVHPEGVTGRFNVRTFKHSFEFRLSLFEFRLLDVSTFRRLDVQTFGVSWRAFCAPARGGGGGHD